MLNWIADHAGSQSLYYQSIPTPGLPECSYSDYSADCAGNSRNGLK